MNNQEVIGRLCRLVKERERDIRVAQTRRMRKSEKAMTLSSYVMDIEALKMAIEAVEHRESTMRDNIRDERMAAGRV